MWRGVLWRDLGYDLEVLVTCRTVIPVSSAVAAMIRKGMERARCGPRPASRARASTAPSSIAGARYSTGWTTEAAVAAGPCGRAVHGRSGTTCQSRSSPEVHIWRVAGNQPWTSASSRAISKRRTNCGALRGLSLVKSNYSREPIRGAKLVVLRVPRWRNASTGGSAHPRPEIGTRYRHHQRCGRPCSGPTVCLKPMPSRHHRRSS